MCELEGVDRRIRYHTQLLLLTVVIEKPRKDAVRGAMYIHFNSSAARPIRVHLLPRDPITGAPAI